jgi:protein tyrosine phosphatase (PTP) superfamily phosphohydrolase (DUF442 family)
MSIEHIVNYCYINPQLATAGQPDEHEVPWIAEAGYQTVINLALHDAEYSLRDEAACVQQQGLDYIHLPVIWQRPTAQNLDDFFAIMQQQQGKQLFIHCAANRRVSVFLGLYFMAQKVWSRQQAKAHIHSIWTPDDNWLIFYNKQLGRLGL